MIMKNKKKTLDSPILQYSAFRNHCISVKFIHPRSNRDMAFMP